LHLRWQAYLFRQSFDIAYRICKSPVRIKDVKQLLASDQALPIWIMATMVVDVYATSCFRSVKSVSQVKKLDLALEYLGVKIDPYKLDVVFTPACF